MKKTKKNKNEIPEKLQEYIPLVHFLGKALGTNYEVFLYDLSDKDHKILAIENGYLSGRSEGFHMKDVIIKVLKEKTGDNNKDFLVQNNAVSRDGRRFKSSSMLIKDENEQPIGVLGINFNIEPFFQVNDILKSFNCDISSFENIDVSKVLFTGEVFEDEDKKSDNLETAYKKLIMNSQTFDLNSVTGRQLAIDMLYKEGIFEIRGSVSYIAEKFGISEPSVYRYLNNSKGKEL